MVTDGHNPTLTAGTRGQAVRGRRGRTVRARVPYSGCLRSRECAGEGSAGHTSYVASMPCVPAAAAPGSFRFLYALRRVALVRVRLPNHTDYRSAFLPWGRRPSAVQEQARADSAGASVVGGFSRAAACREEEEEEDDSDSEGAPGYPGIGAPPRSAAAAAQAIAGRPGSGAAAGGGNGGQVWGGACGGAGGSYGSARSRASADPSPHAHADGQRGGGGGGGCARLVEIGWAAGAEAMDEDGCMATREECLSELGRAMRERFLEGLETDPRADYPAIDADSRLDDRWQRQAAQDAEDRSVGAADAAATLFACIPMPKVLCPAFVVARDLRFLSVSAQVLRRRRLRRAPGKKGSGTLAPRHRRSSSRRVGLRCAMHHHQQEPPLPTVVVRVAGAGACSCC